MVTFSFQIAKRAAAELKDLPDFNDPLTFMEQSWAIGANAVQIAFGVMPPGASKKVRGFAEHTGMRLEATVSLPRNESEGAKFQAELGTLRELGISVARTVIIPGRRYEQFKSFEEFRATVAAGKEALRRAEPVARRHGVRLAVENHKDQRTEERLKLLEEFSSEWIGACLDIGNNLALLEDATETALAFAPWTLTVHFKDQAVREYADGFLLADIPLGAGCIELRGIIEIVRARKPGVQFHLELITRDALKVPVLREDFWPTFGEMRAPDLAKTINLLKRASAKEEFPVVSTLPWRERVAAERANVEQSFRYAAEHLGFSV